MKLVVASALLLPGCLWANEHSESLTGFQAQLLLDDSAQPAGGAVHGTLGYAGLTADFEANVRDVTRPGDLVLPTVPGEMAHLGDPTTARAVGLGFDLRGSLLGILATDHSLERYFDIGVDAGAGVGGAFASAPHELTGTASGWYGAWTEVGTVSVHGGYLAVTGGIRREVFDDHFFDQTQLMVGLAWRKREPLPDGALHFHD